ncbi:glycosyltransferase [Thiocystis violascens]|nr:glycosyltransferase [Thiocystis violascens]
MTSIVCSAILIDAKPRARPPSRNRPLVSAIIPVHNAARFIRDCLDSVFAQSGPFALDVIVVDDGSTDDSLAELRGYAGVRCIEQPNRGPAAARNAALRLAQGDYLAFLDSDDLWPDGKLARQIALLEAHPEIGLAFGDCRQFDAQGPYVKTLFESAGYDSAYWGDPVEVVAPYAKLISGNFITTGSVVMRRACVERVGEFDETLRLVEDLEYWFRVALACPMAHLDAVYLLRRRHPENTSRDPIAMTLAYLRMLDAHRQREADRVRPHAAALRSRMTREFQELGHLYSRQGAHGDAARAYLRALSGKVSLRSIYYLASALAARVGLTWGATT